MTEPQTPRNTHKDKRCHKHQQLHNKTFGSSNTYMWSENSVVPNIETRESFVSNSTIKLLYPWENFNIKPVELDKIWIQFVALENNTKSRTNIYLNIVYISNKKRV